MRKLIVVIFVIAIGAIAKGQVYTPMGSLVDDTNPNRETISGVEKNYILERMAIEYPRATVIGEATSTYNCHAYAWHMSEGGTPVWMGFYDNPTSIYWTDNSYVQSTDSGFEGRKVSYASDNHSAVTTKTVGIFISKWGSWPLMRHEKSYCPYNSSNLKYYHKNRPSGPSIMQCSEVTSFTFIKSGTWEVSPNLQIISGQGTNRISVRANTSNYNNRDATVSFKDFTNNDFTANITIGLPIVTSILSTGNVGNGVFYFAANPYYSTEYGYYQWGVYPTDGSTIMDQINNQIRVKFAKPGTYVVSCSSGSSCTGAHTPIVNILTITQSDLR